MAKKVQYKAPEVPEEKKVAKATIQESKMSQLAVVKMQRIGRHEVTGEPLFKPFNWTGLKNDYETFLKQGQMWKVSGKDVAVFNSYIIIEEIQLPEGCLSVKEWMDSQKK